MLRSKRNEVVMNSIMVPLQCQGQNEAIGQVRILARAGLPGSTMARARFIVRNATITSAAGEKRRSPMPSDEIHLVAPEERLESSRLYLEPILPAHASVLYERLRDERLCRFIPQDPPASPQTLEDRYGFLSARRSPDGREAWLNWAVRERSSGDYAGTLEATVHDDRTAMVAYMVFVPHQRRGFAAEACGRLVEHLFQDYGVSMVAAEIDTRNVASVALVESLGFERVGFQKDADHFKGSTSGEYRYEIKEGVWAAKRRRS
jgi:ribosomal-protein-alanine N-acetyltransferase